VRGLALYDTPGLAAAVEAGLNVKRLVEGSDDKVYATGMRSRPGYSPR
jgi:hypothetical protein